MHIAVNYWMGSYERGLELAREGSEIRGLGPQSAEYVIGSFGQIGLNLAGLGRYEEAIARGDEAIATAHRLGAWDIRVTNDSTGPLRDVYALEEARRRSERMVERLGPSDFNMPWMNARADLICAQLLADDVGAVEREWPAAWDDAVASPAWEHWLITGRLAVVRAELERMRGRLDDAVTWSGRALDLARPVGRTKYEVVSMITLGRTLAAQGMFADAVSQLRRCRGAGRRARLAPLPVAGARRVGRRRTGASRIERQRRTVPVEEAVGDHPRGRGLACSGAGRRLPRRSAGRRGPGTRRLSEVRRNERGSTFGPNAGGVMPEASSNTSTRPR